MNHIGYQLKIAEIVTCVPYCARQEEGTRESAVALYLRLPHPLPPYLNRPFFYRYGGSIELVRFKKYYGMPRRHGHILIYSLSINGRLE